MSVDKYKDIINTEWTGVREHRRMDMDERAKIFLPFAALKGYEDAIDEKNSSLVPEGTLIHEDFDELP